jgi:hypothetical protein
MEAASSSNIFVSTDKTAWCHNPENQNLNTPTHRNLNPYIRLNVGRVFSIEIVPRNESLKNIIINYRICYLLHTHSTIWRKVGVIGSFRNYCCNNCLLQLDICSVTLMQNPDPDVSPTHCCIRSFLVTLSLCILWLQGFSCIIWNYCKRLSIFLFS